MHLPALMSPHGEAGRSWEGLGWSSSTGELAARVPRAAGAAQEPAAPSASLTCPREGRREA